MIRSPKPQTLTRNPLGSIPRNHRGGEVIGTLSPKNHQSKPARRRQTLHPKHYKSQAPKKASKSEGGACRDPSSTAAPAEGHGIHSTFVKVASESAGGLIHQKIRILNIRTFMGTPLKSHRYCVEWLGLQGEWPDLSTAAVALGKVSVFGLLVPSCGTLRTRLKSRAYVRCCGEYVGLNIGE